jgi:hypothetical protein
MVSPLPPGSFPVNALGFGQEIRFSWVYAPMPVPAALPLFLTALARVGLGGAAKALIDRAPTCRKRSNAGLIVPASRCVTPPWRQADPLEALGI